MNLQDARNQPQFAFLVESTEAESWIDFARRNGPTFECRQVDGAVLLIDNRPVASQSRVMLLGLSRPVRPKLIESIFSIYEEAGVSSFSVHLSPTARPTSLPRMLEQFGFQRGPQEAVLARAPSGAEPPDPYFRIRAATPPDADAIVNILTQAGGTSEAWGRAVASGLESSNWRYYLAADGNTAYALGGLFLNGEVGWMAPTWTLAEYRNRGTQAAIIAHALRDGEAQGCKWITTIFMVNGEPLSRNYARLGFELVYMRPRFVWTAPER